jgi:hypothetical protein
MSVFVDDTEFWKFDISGSESSDLEEYHKPMFIIFNLAVGGWNYVQITDPNKITASMPAKMYVDWIRLRENEWTEYYKIGEHVEEACFGVFTETTPVKNSLKLGTDAHLYLWENTLTPIEVNPYEGTEGWSFKSNPGSWFGAGVHCSTFRDMHNYTNGELHFHMKTMAKNNLAIGIKSADGTEKWVEMIDGKQSYGLVRDGAWHKVVIPLNLYRSVDFKKIEQIFMFNNGGQIPSSDIDVSFDNIYWMPSPNNEEINSDG